MRGFDGMLLQRRRCEATVRAGHDLSGVEMCTLQMKILFGFGQTGVDGIRGCHFPSWRRRRVCCHLPHCPVVAIVSEAKALIRRIGMMAVSLTPFLC